jgi:hypothetical protein
MADAVAGDVEAVSTASPIAATRAARPRRPILTSLREVIARSDTWRSPSRLQDVME